MNDLDETQQSNSPHLSAALTELRQRLECYIQQRTRKQPDPTPVAPQPTLVEPPSKRSISKRLTGAQRAPVLPAPCTESEEELGSAGSIGAYEPASALDTFSEQFGLSPFEKNVLLLCAAMELDTSIAGLCAHAHDLMYSRAHNNPERPFPSFALALRLFDDPAWDVLSPRRPLRYFQLIEIHQPGAECLTTSRLTADERIVNHLKGLDYPDDRLTSFLVPLELEDGPAELAPSQDAVVKTILRRLEQSSQSSPLPAVQLLGPDPISKQLVAHHAAARLGRRLYRLPAELLPAVPSELETLARLWQRESMLLPLALYLDAQELDGAAAEPFGVLSRFLSRSNGFFFLGTRELAPRLAGRAIALDVAKPGSDEQRAAWTEALGADAGESPALLAAQFNLNFPNIRQLADFAQLEAGASADSLPEILWDACCASERPRLDALAQRLEPKATWDDLVLPAAEMHLLRQISAQVRQRSKVYDELGFARKMNRGFGISALFAGDSGTGKSMAAEVIANDLRLNLYRVDLSAVVDKYIGVTEKNLRRLCDAAEDSGVIVLFDEADALFYGKRSEVKDSHDRYANIEINYLLQRIESFRGLAILTTNMKSALDTAFLRRLRFIVNFPFPGVADRRRLWQKVFPKCDARSDAPCTPVADLDYDRLARLNLAGGHVQNIALNAAFLAAADWEKRKKTEDAESSPIVNMPLILEAARAELLKLERPINEAEFRWTEPAPAKPKPDARIREPALA